MKSAARSQPEPLSDTLVDREVALDDLDPKTRAVLRSWTQKYVDLAESIDDLHSKQKAIKDEKIEPLRVQLGLTKIEANDWFIARREGKKSLDKEKLVRSLFQAGVEMRVILAAVEKASSVGQPYTEIKRRKEKE